MGAAGLTRATAAAVLSANYVAARLDEHFPVLYKGDHGPGRARVHPRPARADQGHRRQRRRRRQAAHRLRLPRADDVVPGGRHPDGRAHRVGGPRRDRPVLRRDDRDPPRDRPVAAGEWSADDSPLRHAPHTSRALVGEWDRAYSREAGCLPGRSRPGQVLAAGRPRSTRRTATATWSAPARRPRRSPRSTEPPALTTRRRRVTSSSVEERRVRRSSRTRHAGVAEHEVVRRAGGASRRRRRGRRRRPAPRARAPSHRSWWRCRRRWPACRRPSTLVLDLTGGPDVLRLARAGALRVVVEDDLHGVGVDVVLVEGDGRRQAGGLAGALEDDALLGAGLGGGRRGGGAPASPRPRRAADARARVVVRMIEVLLLVVGRGCTCPRRGQERTGCMSAQCAWETLDMLKSGTRRAGVAVREK